VYNNDVIDTQASYWSITDHGRNHIGLMSNDAGNATLANDRRTRARHS